MTFGCCAAEVALLAWRYVIGFDKYVAVFVAFIAFPLFHVTTALRTGVVASQRAAHRYSSAFPHFHVTTALGTWSVKVFMKEKLVDWRSSCDGLER